MFNCEVDAMQESKEDVQCNIDRANRQRHARMVKRQARMHKRPEKIDISEGGAVLESPWTMTTTTMDTFIDVLRPEMSIGDAEHLPTAASVIAANESRSQAFPEDMLSSDLSVENVVSTSPHVDGCTRSEGQRRAMSETDESSKAQSPPISTGQHDKSASPTNARRNGRTATTTECATAQTPTPPKRSSKTPIMSIDDIVRKHSPGVSTAFDNAKAKARKELGVPPSSRWSGSTDPSGDAMDTLEPYLVAPSPIVTRNEKGAREEALPSNHFVVSFTPSSTAFSVPSTPTGRPPSSEKALKADLSARTPTPQRGLRITKRRSVSAWTVKNSPAAVEADPKAHVHALYLRSSHLNQIINLNGLRISFAEVGPASGHPVVVFLGLGCVRYQISLFDDMAHVHNLRLICIDRWGFGKTDQVIPTQRKVIRWAAVVQGVMDYLNIDRFQVLAHSAGAPYALAVALKMGDRVRGQVHLLAPWVSAEIDNGYKWLKWVPNRVIRGASAAEWRYQSYRIGKPPSPAYKPIWHDSRAPQSNIASSEIKATPSSPRGGTGQLGLHGAVKMSPTSWPGTRSPSRLHLRPSVESFQSARTVRGSDRQTEGNGHKPPVTRAYSHGLLSSSDSGRDPFSMVEFERTLALVTDVDGHDDDDLLLALDDVKSFFAADLAEDGHVKDIRPVGLNKPDLDRSMTSSTHGSRPELSQSVAPTGPAFTLAVTQASHAECEPGTTSDLLSVVLNRSASPWGFAYTDVTHPVTIWYGGEDNRVSEKSMRWMERSMCDVELIIKPGEGHTLMSSRAVMWDVFDSLAKEARAMARDGRRTV
ncbi:hypothetical protein IAU60_002310 [Kwoniella sp. DSM 27419]